MKQSVTVGVQLLWGGRYGCNNGHYGCTIVMSYIEINKAVSQWLLTVNLCVSVTWPLTCAFHVPCTHTPEIIDMHRGVCDNTGSCSDLHQKIHQSFALMAFCEGNPPVPKWPVMLTSAWTCTWLSMCLAILLIFWRYLFLMGFRGTHWCWLSSSVLDLSELVRRRYLFLSNEKWNELLCHWKPSVAVTPTLLSPTDTVVTRNVARWNFPVFSVYRGANYFTVCYKI